MKTRVILKYFVNDIVWKHCFTSNSPQTPSKLTSFRILVVRKAFTQFEPKTRVINLEKKVLTFALLGTTAFPNFLLRSKFGIKRLSSLF